MIWQRQFQSQFGGVHVIVSFSCNKDDDDDDKWKAMKSIIQAVGIRTIRNEYVGHVWRGFRIASTKLIIYLRDLLRLFGLPYGSSRTQYTWLN